MEKRMKKKNLVIVGLIIALLVVIGLVTSYIDSARVRNSVEPKFTIKIVNEGGNKVTYWGLGYKVVRYVGVSPKEPYQNNIGVKMGSWFMKYELSNYDNISVELLTEGKTIEITNRKDIEAISSLLKDSKYISEICNGINTHKIVLDNETYYIKDDCKEIQKGKKQAKISEEDHEMFKKIIEETYKDSYSSNTTMPYIPDGLNVADGNEAGKPADSLEFNRNAENVTIEIIKDTITNRTLEILITDNNEDQYGWGVEFKVQEKVNGEWQDLKYVSDDLSWIDIAYELNKDNQLTQKLDIEKYYGELSNGIYRIVKPVYDKGYIDLYSNEFEIK